MVEVAALGPVYLRKFPCDQHVNVIDGSSTTWPRFLLRGILEYAIVLSRTDSDRYSFII